jgi:trimethylguanosine synthase
MSSPPKSNTGCGTGAHQTPSKDCGAGDPIGHSRGRRTRNKGPNNGSQPKSRPPSHEEELVTARPTSPQNSCPRNKQHYHKKNKSASPTRRQDTNSKSPTRRQNNKSHSPIRRNNSNNSPARHKKHSPQHHHHHSPQQHHHHQRHAKHDETPADMTVIVNRVDLWDLAAHFQPEDKVNTCHHPEVPVGAYKYSPNVPPTNNTTCATVRVPYNLHEHLKDAPRAGDGSSSYQNHCENVIDTSMPNPYDATVCHDKYWAQRRRLFHRFDRGIQLDAEGWYSVTPEIIADHVAQRVAEMSVAMRTTLEPPELPKDLSSPDVQDQLQRQPGIVVLDAFSGCGGNAIAFGKMPFHLISKVVCCDTDRAKLMKAAHNASIYDIPVDKLVFVECNAIFVLQYCYKNGEFCLDKPTDTMPPHMPKPVMPRLVNGYPMGGLDLLPHRIHAVFMDPPWGGVDYEILGKNGYDLFQNMKIQVGTTTVVESEEEEHQEAENGGAFDDFFDNFATSAPKPKKQNAMSHKARRANFNKKTEGEFINGFDLVKLAAEATENHVVIYDLPRNTNKTSLGKAALAAGYRGNIKLEEHHLNGRLKTVTGYLGADYGGLLPSSNVTAPSATVPATTPDADSSAQTL